MVGKVGFLIAAVLMDIGRGEPQESNSLVSYRRTAYGVCSVFVLSVSLSLLGNDLKLSYSPCCFWSYRVRNSPKAKYRLREEVFGRWLDS